MSKYNISRRRFIEGSLASALLYGAGSLPVFKQNAWGMAEPLNNRVLIDLFLNGAPDFRHLVVPAFDSTPGSFGAKYWANRERSHNLDADGIAGLQRTQQSRWEEDFFPITVGGSGWSNNVVDASNLNGGVTFGIWKEAGWLIKMFQEGNVAMIFNAVGSTNRAHDLSQLMAYQGDLSIDLDDGGRSGWGGRLARAAGGRAIALEDTSSPFTFGPVGQPGVNGYNPNAIDNSQLLTVSDSRDFGLVESELNGNPFIRGQYDEKMGRAAGNYYAALRQENIGNTYQKFLDHEFNIRAFGGEIQQRLSQVPVPQLIESLMEGANGINPGPNNNPIEREVLSITRFGRQILSAYDMIALNDLSTGVNGNGVALNPRVLSMGYGRWDSHAGQRLVDPSLVADPNNPRVNRGIENGLKDIFGGPSVAEQNVPHGGLSALWESINGLNRQNVAFTIYGEFGRQIRDNGRGGTDHGSGTMMMVIGENVRGGVYGEIFPQEEIPRYDEAPNRTPEIEGRSEFDTFFSKVCDWVSPDSGSIIFPRTATDFSGQKPLEEVNGMFDNLFS